jgi:hypothetical protein
MSNELVRVVIEDSTAGIKISDVGVIRKIEGKISKIHFLRINKQIGLTAEHFRIIDPSLYGDDFPEKICNVCHQILPTVDFDKNQNGINNRTVRRPSCKTCRLSIDGVGMSSSEKRKWVAKKPHRVDFECPICKKITIAGVTSKVVLNHDHATGRILGWICDSCNTGLGRFKDDIAILKEAINYLETH